MAARKSAGNKGKRTVMGAPDSDGFPWANGGSKGKPNVKNVKKTVRSGNKPGNPFVRKGK